MKRGAQYISKRVQLPFFMGAFLSGSEEIDDKGSKNFLCILHHLLNFTALFLFPALYCIFEAGMCKQGIFI